MNKTRINAKLLLASKNAATGHILYTWELTFPRIILAEVLTHRVASRNTSSTRAIPTSKLLASVLRDPFIPRHIGANKRGMQAGGELRGFKRSLAVGLWSAARYPAVAASWALTKLGVHKQIAGRILEPWMWCVQVFSATDVNNLLLLRTDGAAEPHFRELALQMQDQVEGVRVLLNSFYGLIAGGKGYVGTVGYLSYVSLVQILEPGSWHLPYLTNSERAVLPLETKQELSIARCANTSYTTVGEGKVIDAAKAHSITEKLFGGEIKHLSPAEHVACTMKPDHYFGNFRSFCQYRHTIAGESGGDR